MVILRLMLTRVRLHAHGVWVAETRNYPRPEWFAVIYVQGCEAHYSGIWRSPRELGAADVDDSALLIRYRDLAHSSTRTGARVSLAPR